MVCFVGSTKTLHTMKTVGIYTLILIVGITICAAGSSGGGSGSGGRHLFHESGHKGPNTYRFGFDTGPGPNRQFRYEEKDADGYVRGKYGYYDSKGKAHVTTYESHPKHGFAAQGDYGKFPN